MNRERLKPNPGKKLTITVGDASYKRYPVKTHLITEKDSIAEIVKKYVEHHIKPGDIVVVSERIVAISQGRSFLIKDIKPGVWAKLLCRFVYNHPGGIGLRSPWTMQLAIQEAGLLRILLGCAAAVVTKPFGMRGVFYRTVGCGVNAIDGPAEYTLPPGNKSAKLGPKNPGRVAHEISQTLGDDIGAVIIDANDYGVNIMGSSEGVNTTTVRRAFRDNPMGQTDEQTPIVILRRAD